MYGTWSWVGELPWADRDSLVRADRAWQVLGKGRAGDGGAKAI